MISILRTSPALLTSFVLLAIACGHKPPPPPTEPTDVAENEDDGAGTVMATADIGGMNEEQVSRVFSRAAGGFEKCLTSGAHRIEFLGGDVQVYALIDRSGALAHAHVESSSLGDRTTEKCLLEVLERQTWPKPVGGDKGVARKSFGFEPSGDVRPPVDWSPDEVDATLRKLEGDVDDCKHGVIGTFTATMYIDTNGSPLAVGMAPPNDEGEAAVDCLVGVLESARFPSPGSWPAKVTFPL
ncbi:MAG: AgmX/PglI C-terminal domain-containing protein [Polyangiaceae bacterium]|nr:AgmX/PglI C-terminal domain-containing protein [Polyangiaceae bacterium]